MPLYDHQELAEQFRALNIGYRLEFYCYNTSTTDWEWVDYSSRLQSFGNVRMQIERNAFPHSFTMSLNQISLNNIDGHFSDASDIDPQLTNSSEPYGEAFYKRKVRLTALFSLPAEDDNVAVTGVAMVQDLKLTEDGNTAILSLMSLDALSTDQKCDGETVNRHDIGGTSSASPADWTTTEPASKTGDVNLYRWRETDEEGEVTFGWFKNRNVFQVIERTCWALDDLDNNIESDNRLFTGDGREVATIINIPPDDPDVSEGTGPMRTRAMMWNPYRERLCLGIGNELWEYNPADQSYTKIRDLDGTREIIRMWWVAEADSSGYDNRLVVLCEVVDDLIANRTTDAKLYTLNGETASYTQRNLQTLSDYFSCVNMINDGTDSGLPPGTKMAGRPLGNDKGENMYNMCPQRIRAHTTGTMGSPIAQHQDWTPDMDYPYGTDASGYTQSMPVNVNAGYWGAQASGGGASDLPGFAFSWGQFPQGEISYHSGISDVRFAYFEWTSANGYRIRLFNLYNYGSTDTLTLNTSNVYVPVCMHCPKNGHAYDDRIYTSRMKWDHGAGFVSDGVLDRYSRTSTTWTNVPYLTGATGQNLYWVIMQITTFVDSIYHPAILWNRAMSHDDSYDPQWLVVKDVGTTWASTVAQETLRTPNRCQDMHEKEITGSSSRLYFIENSPGGQGNDGIRLHSFSPSVDVINENIGADGVQYPINTDRGSWCMMTSTGLNIPDSSTPRGILFGVSSNDFGDCDLYSKPGEYVMWQYANYRSGSIPLLDLTGLSLRDLRTKLAEAYGFVHYYDLEGTFHFREREQSGSAVVAYNITSDNYKVGTIVTQGWDAILNEIEVVPWDLMYEVKLSDIVKSENGSDSNGMLTDVIVVGDPSASATFRVVINKTTSGVRTFKLEKWNTSTEVWDTIEDAATVGEDFHGYLAKIGATYQTGAENIIIPGHALSGEMVTGDTFTFSIYPSQWRLKQADDFDKINTSDATSIVAYQRTSANFTNRFVRRQFASDYAEDILDWRKDAHPVYQLEVAYNPELQPLDIVTVDDTTIGLDGSQSLMITGITIVERSPWMTIQITKI